MEPLFQIKYSLVNCVHCSGRPITASEAASYGLVAKVFPVEQLVEEAVKTADHIAGLSQVREKKTPHSKIPTELLIVSDCCGDR